MKPLLPVLFMLSVLLPMAAGLSARQPRRSQPGPQGPKRLFVNVVGQAGTPLLDLSPSAFEVTEAGLKVEVVRASLVKEPMRIALLVDTSEESKAYLNHIRSGLRAFLDAIPPQDEILLMTTGAQTRVRVAPTLDRTKLKKAADSVFADGGGAVLLDALRESWTRFLRDAEDRWPVFVVLGTNGPDNSATRDPQFESFIRELQGAAANAHAIMLTSSQSFRNATGFRSSLNVTEYTGGHYEVLAASSALPVRMKALAEQIAAQQRQMSTQYEVDFISRSRDPQAPIMVFVAGEGMGIGLSSGRPIQ